MRLLSAGESWSHAPNVSDASQDSCDCGSNVYLEVTHPPLSGLLSPSARSHNELDYKQLEE